MRKTWLAALMLAAFTVNHGASAAVSAEEAAELKSVLTPMGGERAGNKEGTIPAWEGGYTKVAPGSIPGKMAPDPFADEKPILSITGQNMDAHADKLSEGIKAMLKKHPDYRLDVYPTHRTAAAPQWVYDNTAKNAVNARTEDEGLSVVGARAGIPFPIPKTGNEAMWNHLLSWQGEAVQEDRTAVVTSANGQRVIVARNATYTARPYYYNDVAEPTEYWLVRIHTTAPSFKAGESILARSPLAMGKQDQMTWQYLVGQRRVRRAPSIAYDTPDFISSGVGFFDEGYLFLGRQDRFDFKLVGKKEMYIPYNTNGLHQLKVDEVFSKHFLNPDKVRWELHRVWVVEATLKAGKRHAVAKRRYYLDEDTHIAVLADGWDANGQIWKAHFSLPFIVPELPAVVQGPFGQYDLLTGNWVVNSALNEAATVFKPVPRFSDSFFAPENLAGQSVR